MRLFADVLLRARWFEVDVMLFVVLMAAAIVAVSGGGAGALDMGSSFAGAIVVTAVSSEATVVPSGTVPGISGVGKSTFRSEKAGGVSPTKE